MALLLLSGMVSCLNSNIHDFSQDPSSLLQVHSSHYLYYLQTYCFIHVVISRPNRYLYLSSHGPLHFATSHLLASPSWPNLQILCSYSLSYHYVSPNVTCRCLSRRQYHCYMSYQDLLCYTSITPHSTISGVAATHIITVYQYLDVYLSTWNKRKPSYFVKSFVGWMTAVYLHS